MTPFTAVTNPFSLRSICLAAALLMGSAMALADEVGDVQALLAAGKSAEGLKKVDLLLLAKPSDPRLRLQRGIALSMLNRQAEAIGVFQKLIESHPELPGPYNNLAVLYGNQGDYEKARQALELAIRTNPSYATAFQNLGDVYARLAGQAYKKALALDKSDGTLPLKLSVVQNVFEASVDPRTPKAAAPAPVAPAAPASAAAPATAVAALAALAPAALPAVTTPAKTTAAAAPIPAAKPPAPTPPPAPVPATALAAAPAVKASAAAAVASPVVKPEAAPALVKTETDKPNATDSDKKAIETALQDWAKAWSSRNMVAYFDAYAPDFKGKAASRKAWEQERRDRIVGKKKIAVGLSDMRIKVSGNKASVSLRQDYSSDALSVKSGKNFEMIKSKSGDWLISQESSR